MSLGSSPNLNPNPNPDPTPNPHPISHPHPIPHPNQVPMSLGSLSQAPLSALLSVAGLHRGPSSLSQGRSSGRGGGPSSATVSTPQLLGLSPDAFSHFMDGGIGG